MAACVPGSITPCAFFGAVGMGETERNGTEVLPDGCKSKDNYTTIRHLCMTFVLIQLTGPVVGHDLFYLPKHLPVN